MTSIVSPEEKLISNWMGTPVQERRARALSLLHPKRKNIPDAPSAETLRKTEETRLRKLRFVAERELSRQANVEPGRMARYDLKRGQWARLFRKQGSCCAICKTDKPGAREWHTDHCHADGKVRGILCQKCNTALGGFQDDIEKLQSAIGYLTNPPFSEDV